MHNSGHREEERRIMAEASEPEKTHNGTRGRVAPDHRGGADARAARYRRAPAPGWRRDYTARGKAHAHALLPDTRRRNGGHALFRVLGHHPGPRRQVWLVAPI